MLIFVKKVTKNVTPTNGRIQAGHIAANKPTIKPVRADFLDLHFQKEQFAKRMPPTNGKSPRTIQSRLLKVENALSITNRIISINEPCGKGLIDSNEIIIEKVRYTMDSMAAERTNVLNAFLSFRHLNIIKISI